MKYCLYKDQPMPSCASGESILTGCVIFGVHHDCENCPNLVEMGDETYNTSNIIIQDHLSVVDIDGDATKQKEFIKELEKIVSGKEYEKNKSRKTR